MHRTIAWSFDDAAPPTSVVEDDQRSPLRGGLRDDESESDDSEPQDGQEKQQWASASFAFRGVVQDDDESSDSSESDDSTDSEDSDDDDIRKVDTDPYDPTKPEYIIPASPEEVAALSAGLLLQQIACLEGSIGRRIGHRSANAIAVVAHYQNVVEDLRASIPAISAMFQTQPCPVCLEAASSDCFVVELTCGHRLCHSCAAKCASNHFSSCPVCRHPHLLDPQLLAQRRDNWRSQYGNWRAGKSRGAAGETSSICEPSRRSSRRMQDSMKDQPDSMPELFAATLSIILPVAGEIILAQIPPPRMAGVCKAGKRLRVRKEVPKLQSKGRGTSCWAAFMSSLLFRQT